MMAQVDTAEKEASEVLHSLLSVERVEKSNEVKIENGTIEVSYQTNTDSNSQEVDNQIQWHTPVSIAHTLFSGIESNEQYPQNIEHHQVIWESHSIQGEPETDKAQEESQTELATVIYEVDPLGGEVEEEEEELVIEDVKEAKPKAPHKKPKIKTPLKKKRKLATDVVDVPSCGGNDPTKLEVSASQVKDRFKRGCECQDESCFRGLNPESVYKHRLNIAELTKGEHDMYLMGVTMACLANPDTTVRQKERRRLRAQYVYQGRRVCLDAFLYLENCTHYQLKRIRKHVMTHGVAPRVHGNHGKKPHNTFSLDIYRHATEFIKQYMEQHTGEAGICSSKQPIQLPWDITRKNLHDAYKEYGQILEPGIKLMGYSTFRHFMKEQFPHVKFSKVEPKSVQHVEQTNQPAPVQTQQQANTTTNQQQHIQIKQTIQPVRAEHQNIQIQKCVISNEMQQVIPLVVTPNDGNGTQPQAFIVTPVPQLISNGNLTQTNATTNSFSYQLTNTGYVINEQGNLVTTMANAQHTPFTFNRI